jgi:hypothetical protein
VGLAMVIGTENVIFSHAFTSLYIVQLFRLAALMIFVELDKNVGYVFVHVGTVVSGAVSFIHVCSSLG